MFINELRDLTGLTQKQFAERFGIPLGTLRRWEQGESTPASYIINLIAAQLPVNKKVLTEIPAKNGQTYYYDAASGSLLDSRGTRLFIHTDLEGVNKHNLSLYVQDLFEGYYELIGHFSDDCRFDVKEKITWG